MLRLTTLLVVLLPFLCQPLQADEIRIYTHSVEGAAYTDSSGEMRGKHHGGRRAFLVELVREMMVGLKLKPVMTEVPLGRGIRIIENQPLSALFNVNRNPEREHRFKWVGPLQSDTVYLFEHRNTGAAVRSLDQARQVPAVCVRRGNSHADFLRQQGFTNLVFASSYKSCWEMVAMGRVTLTTLGTNLIPSVEKAAREAAAEIRSTGVKLRDTQGYLAFSVDTPDEVVQRWQAALDKIRSGDIYQSLIHHFFCQQDCF